MKIAGKIEVLFVAGFGPIVREITTSRKLYGEALGIPFKKESGGYLHTEALPGAKTFALWPLSQAAHSCFGNDSWPEDIPVPQAWLEFDVQSVESATAALASQGYRILVENKKGPWGQTVTRLLSPEGLLVGITFTPLMRKENNTGATLATNSKIIAEGLWEKLCSRQSTRKRQTKLRRLDRRNAHRRTI